MMRMEGAMIEDVTKSGAFVWCFLLLSIAFYVVGFIQSGSY